MNGIIEMAQSVFQTSAVRIGVPEKLGGIEEDYEGPEWATAIGLVIGSKNNVPRRENRRKVRKTSSERSGKDNAFKKFIKSLF